MTYDPHNIDELNLVGPSYLASYGLTEPPFSPQLNDRFLYLYPALSEQLELLKHYTEYGNLLLIVSGEHGVGKSSLKQRFIESAQEEWQICKIQSHTMMDSSLLLTQIAQGFGITQPPLEPSILFEVLSEQLERINEASYIPILLVDDAHELPLDALKALLYLAEHHSEKKSGLRIILFCQPEIEVMLEDSSIKALKDRVTHNIHISNLTENETAEYLRHRLAVAGLDGTSPFTPKLINKIFKASNGIPAKINELAHKNLQDDSEPFTKEEDDEEISEEASTSSINFRRLLLAGIAILAIASALYFQNEINQLFDEASPSITENIEEPSIIDRNEEKLSTLDNETVATDTTTFQKEENIEQQTIEISLDDNDKIETPIESDNKELSNPLSKPTSTTVITLTSVNPNPVLSSRQRQIISISGKGFHKRQKVKVAWSEKEKILADTQVHIKSDTYMNLILNVGTQKDTWEVTIIDPLMNETSNSITFDVIGAKNTKEKKKSLATASATLKTKAKNTQNLFGQVWIKNQNKNNFTLQLLGSYDKQTLLAYRKKFSLNDAAIFESTRNNKNWYTLIYGTYATKLAAQSAAKQLPAGMKKNKPWIRSFASIIPALNQNPSRSSSPPQAPIKIVKTQNISVPENQEGWLWSQDPSHYSLQLAAGTDKKAIQSFIKRHKLSGKVAYFHRIRDGKKWYILIHGSYAGYSIAKKAISQLPIAVQKAKPWVRTFGAIHTELN
ncbi:MAG: SPOR domain-containing protein [Woeseiaceae bacterium]